MFAQGIEKDGLLASSANVPVRVQLVPEVAVPGLVPFGMRMSLTRPDVSTGAKSVASRSAVALVTLKVALSTQARTPRNEASINSPTPEEPKRSDPRYMSVSSVALKSVVSVKLLSAPVVDPHQIVSDVPDRYMKTKNQLLSVTMVGEEVFPPPVSSLNQMGLTSWAVPAPNGSC